MPRIVVILPTTTYRATDFIAAGDELGVDLIVASEAEPPIAMGDRYIRIDCDDPDEAASRIVEAGDASAIDGVVAADDRGVVIAAIAASKMGLAGNDPAAARATRDKRLQRQRFEEFEVPQPPWSALGPDQRPEEVAAAIGYPVVVKAPSLSAGQGIFKVDTPDQLLDAVSRASAIVARETPGTNGLVVERYLAGDEVAVEGLVSEGDMTPLAIFDKPAESSGLGFEETMLVTPSRHDRGTQDEIVRVARNAVSALGLSNGPVHVELMVAEDGVAVIEVAGRSIGGLCSRSLDFGLMGTTLESLILRNSVGRDKPEMRKSTRASGALMIPIPAAGELIGVDGVDLALELSNVTGVEIIARPGDFLQPPPEGARYLGFAFASATTPEEVEQALSEVMTTVKVHMK